MTRKQLTDPFGSDDEDDAVRFRSCCRILAGILLPAVGDNNNSFFFYLFFFSNEFQVRKDSAERSPSVPATPQDQSQDRSNKILRDSQVPSLLLLASPVEEEKPEVKDDLVRIVSYFLFRFTIIIKQKKNEKKKGALKNPQRIPSVAECAEGSLRIPKE